MSLLKSEPFAAVESMDELLAIAYAMEQEAIIGYSELAERMRRERRRAFHAEKRAGAQATALDLPELELRLADHLEALATRTQADASSMLAAAKEARERSTDLIRRPFAASPLLRNGIAPEVSGRVVPLCELVLDCYLDFGERLHGEDERNRAQRFAAGAVECRSLLRATMR